MTRTVYLVKTKAGFLGNRRYSYSAGTTCSSDKALFDRARLFARKGDAVQARNINRKGEVVTATVSLDA